MLNKWLCDSRGHVCSSISLPLPHLHTPIWGFSLHFMLSLVVWLLPASGGSDTEVLEVLLIYVLHFGYKILIFAQQLEDSWTCHHCSVDRGVWQNQIRFSQENTGKVHTIKDGNTPIVIQRGGLLYGPWAETKWESALEWERTQCARCLGFTIFPLRENVKSVP